MRIAGWKGCTRAGIGALLWALGCLTQAAAPGLPNAGATAPEAAAASAAAPRATGNPDLREFLAEVSARFRDGDPEAFDSVFPEARGRDLVRSARAQGIPLRSGEGRVIRVEGDEAVVLLAGHPEFDNSGDETLYSRMYSGLFRAVRDDGTWRIASRIPMDADNRILGHDLEITLEPADGVRVVDLMHIDVGGAHGFWAHLNHRAALHEVRVDGKPVAHHFESGLLWVDVPAGLELPLELHYELNVKADAEAGANSGRFDTDSGHLRHQYFWHAFFDFHSAGDHAWFQLRIDAPADVQVVTGVPQTDTVTGSRRTIHGRSFHPVSGLTLLYDREWERTGRRAGDIEVEVFTTPEFRPGASEILTDVEWILQVLGDRFGPPAAPYLAIANGRSRPSGGWRFRSGDVVVSGGARALNSRGGALPRAWLGHEVAHGWTRPTGPGANFLSEGWAMLAEAVLIEACCGPELVQGYWDHHRNVYEREGWEGRTSIVDDPNNGGIAYYKGSWILKMLRDSMGDSAFERGMRGYMGLPPGAPAGLEEFVDAMSAAAERDMGPFLEPWLTGTTIPDLQVTIEDEEIVITQEESVFELLVELELITPVGPVRRRLEIRDARETFSTRGLGPVLNVHIDPDRQLLIRRHRGEVVTFGIEAPDASEVHLFSDFTREPLAATRTGNLWQVTVPLYEGRYAYWWGIDGEDGFREDLEVRIVRPIGLLVEAFPGPVGR